MSGWTDILQDIKQRHPFLRQLEVCGLEDFSSLLPEALQASFDIAENLRCEDPDYKHLAMIFPLLLDCPEWIAVGCSLAAIKQEFLPNIESLTPFSSGPKIAVRWQICCRIRKGGGALRISVLMDEDERKKQSRSKA